MLNGIGIETGVDLDALVAAGQFISNQLWAPADLQGLARPPGRGFAAGDTLARVLVSMLHMLKLCVGVDDPGPDVGMAAQA